MKITLRTTRQFNSYTYSCWRLNLMVDGYGRSLDWESTTISHYHIRALSDFSRSWTLSRQETRDLIRGC